MKKIITILLSLVLTLTMIPASFADTAYAESSIPEIDYGTPGEDYEPGQVIVCVEGGTQALMASGIFSSETTKLASGSKQISAERFDGETGKIDGEKITVEDTLTEFETSESVVDRAAAVSEGDEQAVAEAINDDTSKKEEFSLVLVNTNRDNITSLIEKLNQLDCVRFAEPNIKCEPTSLSINDATGEPAYDYQWYLDKKGTHVDYDISAESAYSNEDFSSEKEVVVAVMDSGVDYTHPDLQGSMWTGGDIQALQNLGGGQYGINTSGIGNKNDPMDKYIGHGTHCASTIASTWNNDKGIAGVNGNVKIMACSWIDVGYIEHWVEAMNYVITAKENGVKVVATSNSWGPSRSTDYCGGLTELMVDLAGEKGIVSCFAAGNGEYNHDMYTNLAYYSPYMVQVGAMQSNGEAAEFSERGKRTVDVFAPGTQILAATSLYNNGNVQMTPQYLPWLQASSDSVVYQNFETDSASEITVAANKYSSDNSFQNAETLQIKDGNGYGDNISKTVDLSTFNMNDQLSFEISIPASELESTGDCYMAFQAGIDGASLYSVNQESGNKNYGLIFMDYYKNGSWIQLPPNDRLYWVISDNNWSVFSNSISNDIMKDIKSSVKNGNVKIRLRMNLEKKEEDNITFKFDNFGIGTKVSKYYYSDGTSMATPCAAGVVSLIAGAMNSIPDGGAEALEVIARLKGGVKETGELGKDCITKGFVQATAAFATDSELNPVPNSVTISGDSATIKGYFFGDNTGTVTIGGYNAPVSNWSEKSITVSIPSDIKYKSYEYVVTKSGDKKGRNFGVFRQNQQAEGKAYREIEIGKELSYEFDDGTHYETEDLLPVRIAANDDGVLALLSDEDEFFNALQFYSSADGTWKNVDLPLDDYHIGKDEPFASIVGVGHNFYFLANDNFYPTDNGNKYTGVYGEPYIVTYNTTTTSCTKSTVKRIGTWNNNDYALCSALSIGYEGKLYLALGSERTDGKIYELNLSTGALTDASKTMGTLSNYFYNSTNGKCVCAGSYLISGDMQIIAGAQTILDRLNDYTPGATSLRATYRISNGNWSDMTKTPSILDIVDGGREYAQNELAAYGALDQGFIMAGPARDIGQDTMVDTWYYSVSDNAYKSIPALVDTERLRAQAGVSYGGRFYVMGNSRSRGNKLFLKYLELEDFGLSVSEPAEITSGGGGEGTGGGTGGGGGGGGGQEEPETKTTDAEPVVTYDSEESGLNVAIEGLTEGKDYKVELPEDSDKVGTHTAEIVFMGAYSKMEKKTVTYVVLPRGTEISKISGKKNSIIVCFNKQTSQTTGYQIRYSTSSKMKSAKSITIKKNTATKKTIKKLKSKKKYYVQTRTYTKVKEGKSYKNYYSHWGKTKSVKVK